VPLPFIQKVQLMHTSIIKWMKFERISWGAHDFHGVGLYKNNLKLGCPSFYFINTFGGSSMSELKHIFFQLKDVKGKNQNNFHLFFYHIEF
jgi:hypothetical protein